jgi:ectoine hydroxylase-related dioxygenase (phytanoyl-CoA dioxygenase family)
MPTSNHRSDWVPNPELWRAQYEATGYLLVENAIDADTLQELRVALEQIEHDYAEGTLSPALSRYVFTDQARSRALGHEGGANTISNIMELPVFAPIFRDLIVYPRVLDVLESIFETSEFSFHNYKCICKMPHNNTPFQWHRDLPYLQHTTPNLLTCMICVDDMTVENGATVVCPGTHHIAHEDVKASDKDIPEAEVPLDRVTVTCPAGSIVLFHVNIVHGGGPNLSDGKRRNVISIWSGPDCYPITGERYAYEFVMPRSKDPMRQKQIEMCFDKNVYANINHS